MKYKTQSQLLKIFLVYFDCSRHHYNNNNNNNNNNKNNSEFVSSDNMAEQASPQQTEKNNWLTAGRTRRLKWSSDMINDLLECKKRAQELASSEELARNTNSRKKGYMKILKELWDDLGYAGLNLTCQNLRDQAARMERWRRRWVMLGIRLQEPRGTGGKNRERERARS